MNTENLIKANQLMTKVRSIQQAVAALQRGDTIVAMSIGRAIPEDDPMSMMPMGVMVPTQGITYPAQMLESIRTQFVQRWNELADELGKLGATEIPRPS